MLVGVVCSLIYPLISIVGAFLLLRFFHGFSTGFKPTGTSAYVSDMVPVTRRGEAMGMVGLFRYYRYGYGTGYWRIRGSTMEY